MNTIFTYLMTIIMPLLGGGNALANSIKQPHSFFSKAYTDVFKGLACLIVIYVHVSSERGNMLQDAIGSFAYVCVTFFFLVSAYGMMWSVEHTEKYLTYFWRNRLVSLLIPVLIVNLVCFVLDWLVISNKMNFSLLYSINSYVVVLLQYCILFYIVEISRYRWFRENKALGDWLLILGVVASSLFFFFFQKKEIDVLSGWCHERLGLVWGILLYRYFEKITTWMNKSRTVKTILLTIVCIILGMFYVKYKLVFFWGSYLMKVLLGVMLLLLLFTVTSNRKFGDNISNWLGSISYEVYLSHFMVLGVMSFLLPPDINSGIFICCVIVATLFLSTGMHFLSKPLVKALRA